MISKRLYKFSNILSSEVEGQSHFQKRIRGAAPAPRQRLQPLEASGKAGSFLYRDTKCGLICLSHAAQLPVLNRRKCSPTFHESSNISLNISYLVITKIFVLFCEFLAQIFKYTNLELQQYLLITLRKIELILIGGSGKEQTKVDFISFMISYLLYNMFVSFQKEIFEETYYMILDIFPFLLCWL